MITFEEYQFKIRHSQISSSNYKKFSELKVNDYIFLYVSFENSDEPFELYYYKFAGIENFKNIDRIAFFSRDTTDCFMASEAEYNKIKNESLVECESVNEILATTAEEIMEVTGKHFDEAYNEDEDELIKLK